MGITDYVRQLKPRNEAYVPHVEKIQSFLSESTDESTKMELVIVACYNLSGKNKKAFAEAIVKDRGVQAWWKVSKNATGIDGKKLNASKNLSDQRVTDSLYSFAQLLKKNAPTTGRMSSAGQSNPSTSNFWKYHTGKGKDVSKADIMLGNNGVSVKGLKAQLMSGIGTETKATAIAAFARANGTKGLSSLQSNILSSMDNMISSTERIDLNAPPEVGEKNTRSMGKLTVDDAIKYGITQKKDGSFTDDRWLTSRNMETVRNSDRGEAVTDWTKVNYEILPPVKVKDKAGKDVEVTDSEKHREIVDRVNTAASTAIDAAKAARDDLVTNLKTIFNDKKVGNAFAWEAMSGFDKFNDGTSNPEGEIPQGKGGDGFASQMLVFDWGLQRIAWYEIKPNGPNVSKTATQMSIKFDLKSGSYKAGGKKAGYAFSQTLRLGIDYIKDKSNEAGLVMEEQTHQTKQMLAEGQLDEWSFWKKLKDIWNTFMTKIKDYWSKFKNFLIKIKNKIVEIFNSGLNSVLEYFELDVNVKVRTTVKLL